MAKAAIEHGTGNFFADLGLAGPAELQTKTRLAMALNRLIKERGLKQADVARQMAIPQPKVSALVNYRLDGLSVERLMEFLTLMGCDVEIIVRPAQAAGCLRVLEVA